VQARRWSFIDNEDVGLEAAIIERKRNSSPIERLCAANDRGSNISPKLRAYYFIIVSGRRVFQSALKAKG